MSIVVHGHGDKAHIVAADEIQHLTPYSIVINIGLDTLQGVEHRCGALIDMAVCLGGILDILVREGGVLAPVLSVFLI